MGWCAIPRFGIVGPTYEAESVNLDAQLTENFYVEADESGAGNAPIALMATPGIKKFVDMNPAPSFLKPQLLGAASYNWNLAGGSDSGDSRLNIPVPNPALNIGDTLFLFFCQEFQLGQPDNPLLSVTAPAMVAGNLLQLGPTQNLGLISGGERRYFQIFYAKATSPVPALSLTINIFVGNPIHSAWFSGGAVMYVRNLDVLDQVTSNIANTATVAATAITTTQPTFFMSSLGNNSTFTSPNPDPTIYHLAASGTSGVDPIVAFFILDPILGDLFTAPAGTYAPVWTQDITVPFNAGAINASFKLVPA